MGWERGGHTSVQLCLRVLDNIASNARLIRPFLNLLLQHRKQFVHVHITPVLELDRLVALARKEAE
jgi:hypothetical protein